MNLQYNYSSVISASFCCLRESFCVEISVANKLDWVTKIAVFVKLNFHRHFGNLPFFGTIYNCHQVSPQQIMGILS